MQFRLLQGPHKKRQGQKLMKSLEPWWTVRHDCSFHKIMSLPTISFIFYLNPTHLQMLMKLKLKVIFQHFNIRLIRILTEMHAHMLAHPPVAENCIWKTYLFLLSLNSIMPYFAENYDKFFFINKYTMIHISSTKYFISLHFI